MLDTTRRHVGIKRAGIINLYNILFAIFSFILLAQHSRKTRFPPLADRAKKEGELNET